MGATEAASLGLTSVAIVAMDNPECCLESDTGTLGVIAYNLCLCSLRTTVGPVLSYLAFTLKVHDRSRICCAPSALLNFMVMEVNCSCAVENSSPGDVIVSSLQIADGAVLLASSACDLWCAVELFTDDCVAAGERVTTFKFEVVYLS